MHALDRCLELLALLCRDHNRSYCRYCGCCWWGWQGWLYHGALPCPAASLAQLLDRSCRMSCMNSYTLCIRYVLLPVAHCCCCCHCCVMSSAPCPSYPSHCCCCCHKVLCGTPLLQLVGVSYLLAGPALPLVKKSTLTQEWLRHGWSLRCFFLLLLLPLSTCSLLLLLLVPAAAALFAPSAPAAGSPPSAFC
jgi:hypothetical protein